jgi:hypothetical protein
MTTPLTLSCDRRRGMMILMVLAMLTFFILAGAMLLTLAMRSRTSARAFAAATRDSGSALLARDMLDEALRVLIRGTQLPNPPPNFTESILEDKYGSTFVRFTGTASSTSCSIAPVTPLPMVSGSTQPIPMLLATLTPSSTASPPPHPCHLNGRVLTIKPAYGDGDVRSFRILRATATGTMPSLSYGLYLDSSAPGRPLQFPTQPFEAHISGREFTPLPSGASAPEAYDAFDVPGNAWLAKPLLRTTGTPAGVSVVSVQPSYRAAASPSPPVVDNDNDSVADGIWLPPIDPSGTSALRLLPDLPSPNGGVLKFQVSYLVLDLDGRLNVNTSGLRRTGTWNSQPPTAERVAPGSGYGTADVDGARILTSASASAFTGVPLPVVPQPKLWTQLLQSGAPTTVSSGAALDGTYLSAAQSRLWPLVGACDGRYGADGEPGLSGTAANQVLAQNQLFTQQARRLWGNSPSDLKARMKLFMAASPQGVPTLTWFSPNLRASDMASVQSLVTSDLTGSPYALRLDDAAARGEWVRRPAAGPESTARPADNPFSLAELEPILRIHDEDASSLAPRLAALLEDFGQRSRMTITTDSWDTVAITGSAAVKLQAYMASFPVPGSPSPLLPALGSARPYDLMAPEVTAGMKFDLNRPLEAVGLGYPPVQEAAISQALKQHYCRDLFTLLVALGRPADKKTAQWVANVCDFRDADSTMTRFVFDDKLQDADGWNPVASPETVVFGMERPELVITEARVWDGGMCLVLHHPWKAVVTGTDGSPLEVETVAEALRPTASPALNKVAVNRKVNDAQPASKSIWRLEVDGGGKVDLGEAGKNNPDCDLGPNEYLCVQTDGPPPPSFPRPVIAGSLVPPAAAKIKVVLKRLADPTAEESGDNPYIEVDSADLVLPPPPNAPKREEAKVQRRNATPFWQSKFAMTTEPEVRPYPGAAEWLHWPNRPFISSAELALVPSGSSSEVTKSYASPTPTEHLQPPSLAVAPELQLFDAVHVPTWFAGQGLAIGGDNLLRQNITSGSYASNTLPSWREPGRLNVNTVLQSSGTSAAAEPAIADGVWRSLVPTWTGSSSPFIVSNTSFAASFTQALSLAATAGQKTPWLEATDTQRGRNPLFNHSTAIRLAATSTIRSNVFAVWITVRMEDTSVNAPPPSYRRLFAIIDRSIPVGYSKGENLDSLNVIRLKRFLD